MRDNLKPTILLAMIASTASGYTTAQDGQWRFSTGSDFSTGNYQGDPVDTEITYLPFTTSYRSGFWTLQATVPWVQIDGPGTVLGAGDGGVVVGKPRRNPGGNPGTGGEEVTVTSQSGLGDIWLSSTYSGVSVPGSLFYLDLGAKVKIPTADEDKGLGTGKMDYSLQADLFKPVGNATPYLTLAYKIKGEPAGIDINNVVAVSAGSDFAMSSETHVGLSLDYQEAAVTGNENSLEMFGYLNQTLTNSWGVMLYGYKGLTDGSPDYGIGFQLSYNP